MIHPVHLLATYIHQLYVDAMLMFPVMCHVSLHFAIKMLILFSVNHSNVCHTICVLYVVRVFR